MSKLVFLGTPEIAVEPLRALVDSGHDVVLVVTRPDRRRGRGSSFSPSPVKEVALELGLKVTDRLDDVLLAAEGGAGLGVVVAFGRIIPASLLDALPMINLHFSLLPRWRGAAPVERAILAGDSETGVCVMAVEAGLDTGPVYECRGVTIGAAETADELKDRLSVLGSAMLVELLASGVGSLPVPKPQVGVETYANKIAPSELELDFGQPAEVAARTVRLGRAWTTFGGKRLRILEARPTSSGRGRPVGSLDGASVATGAGELLLETVQAEGGRPMSAADWIRGARPEPGAILGRLEEPVDPAEVSTGAVHDDGSGDRR